MRNDKDRFYGNDNRRYPDYDQNYQRDDRRQQERGWGHEQNRPQNRYRMDQDYQNERGGRGGDYQASQEDYYNTVYDTNNYSGVPRHDEYGLPHGPENDMWRISRGNPQFYNPDSFERTRYRYSSGYNPNYDNPEEGDQYRNFDSRGNHGYRHDASYGTADEFRDFGDDHYGSRDR